MSVSSAVQTDCLSDFRDHVIKCHSIIFTYSNKQCGWNLIFKNKKTDITQYGYLGPKNSNATIKSLRYTRKAEFSTFSFVRRV